MGGNVPGGQIASRPAALFLTQSFPPETHAGANRAKALADALAIHFHTTVVAPQPSHPTPDHHSAQSTRITDSSQPYHVARSNEFRPHSAGYLRRGTRELGMALRLAMRETARVDVVVGTSPSFFVGPAAYASARLRGAAFAWDLRDLTWVYAQEGLERGTERRRLRVSAAHALSAVAHFLMRNADVVMTSNEGIARVCRVHRSSNAPTWVVPNGISEDLYLRLARVANTPMPDATLRVTYAGAIGYYQSLDTMLEVAEVMPEVEFYLVGDGPDRDRLESLSARQRLENVVFTGYVDRETLCDIYAQSHVLFAQLRDLEVMAKATFPSKPFEYLAAGRPIVYAGRGITAEFLASTGAALIADPQNAESIRQAIAKLRGDASLRAEMGELGRACSSEHIREDVMAAVARDLYSTIAGTPPTSSLTKLLD